MCGLHMPSKQQQATHKLLIEQQQLFIMHAEPRYPCWQLLCFLAHKA
jgi:hypothetical protein